MVLGPYQAAIHHGRRNTRLKAPLLVEAGNCYLLAVLRSGEARLDGGEGAQHLSLPGWLRPLATTIETGLEQGLRVRDLARLAGLSPQGLHERFRRELGTTPGAFLFERRMQRAARLLRERPGVPVRKIARLCGYRSATSFSARFRGHFGRGPSRWRRG